MNLATAAFQAVTGLIQRTTQTRRVFTGLISSYLSNLLWLIDRTFFKLSQEGYGGNSVVYAVLTTLSRAVAEPPLVAYVEDDEGQLDKIPSAHPLQMLIKVPTPGLMTQYELWELLVLYMGIAGRFNGFIERSFSGQPIGIWPLRPDRVGPIYSTMDDPVARVIKGWSYQVPGTSQYIAIPREDVLTVNFPDPSGESGGLIEGLGPLQALAVEVSADNEASKLVGALTANNATPSLAITTASPIQNREQAELLKQGWMQQFGGTRRGEPAILDAGADIKQLSFNLSQLEFPTLRNIAEARIAAAFGVPAALAGLKTGIDRAADANLDGLRLYFTETTLEDYWRRFEDAFTNQVAAWWGPNVVCRFDRTRVRALHQQTRTQKQPIADGFALGAVTVDEYRQRVLDLDPLPNGQGAVFMIPSGVIPTLDPHKAAEEPPPPLPEEGSGAGVQPAPAGKF